MGLQKEIWTQDIKEELYANNSFIQNSVNHGEFVDNKIVHVPQAGGAPNVEINRSSLPASISERTDTELTYTLDEFTTDPMLIRDLDEIQTSYNKRQSVLGHHTNQLNEEIALNTIVDWAAPSSKVVATSGGLESILPAGATGTRKALTKDDIRNLARIFDADNVPMNDRYLLVPSDMMYQLTSDSELMRFDAFGQNNFTDGVVGELFTFKLIKRSAVAIYDVSNAVKAVGAASAVDDNLAAIAWQSGMVAKALGNIKVYADEDKPEYYGSVFSAMVLHKGSKLRSDNKGVGAIVQEA